MLSDQTLAKLDALTLALKDHARGGAGGVRRSRMLGSSAEFSDFRSYAPGDDIRRIDWNAYARFDKLFLKLFMEEQEMCLTLIVDASKSMGFGEPGKWLFVRQLAEAIGYLALRNGDKVRLVALHDGRALESALMSGRASMLRMSEFLDGIEPGGDARMDEQITRLRMSAPRGLSVVISDLLYPGEAEQALSSLVFRRQQTALIQVLSPEELHPEYAGALRLLDSETEQAIELMMNRDTLDDYERTLTAMRARIEARANKLGYGYQLLTSDQDLVNEAMRQLAGMGLVQ